MAHVKRVDHDGYESRVKPCSQPDCASCAVGPDPGQGWAASPPAARTPRPRPGAAATPDTAHLPVADGDGGGGDESGGGDDDEFVEGLIDDLSDVDSDLSLIHISEPTRPY